MDFLLLWTALAFVHRPHTLHVFRLDGAYFFILSVTGVIAGVWAQPRVLMGGPARRC